MKQIYHIVYQTTNLINNKIYVGVHSTTNILDSYLGSGKALRRAIKKYGVINFKKKILSYHDSEDKMYLEESKIVTLEFVKRKDTYNQKLGGRGVMMKLKHSKKSKKKMNFTRKNKKYKMKKESKSNLEGFIIRYGVNIGLEKYLEANNSKARPGELNGMYGRTHTQESINSLRAARSKYSKEQNIQSYTRIKSKEEKAKISKSRKERRVCRIRDKREMDLSNFTRYL